MPENQRPHEHGCTGFVKEETKWKHPIKERRSESGTEKREYPAKKSKKQRKGRA